MRCGSRVKDKKRDHDEKHDAMDYDKIRHDKTVKSRIRTKSHRPAG
jgi:hypothetical protein